MDTGGPQGWCYCQGVGGWHRSREVGQGGRRGSPTPPSSWVPKNAGGKTTDSGLGTGTGATADPLSLALQCTQGMERPCEGAECSGLGTAGRPGLTHSCFRCPASPRRSACAHRPRWPAQRPSASRSCCTPGISFWHPCRGALPLPPGQAGGQREGREGGGGIKARTEQGCRAVRRRGCHSRPRAAQSWAQGVPKPGHLELHWWRRPGRSSPPGPSFWVPKPDLTEWPPQAFSIRFSNVTKTGLPRLRSLCSASGQLPELGRPGHAGSEARLTAQMRPKGQGLAG